MVRRSFTPEERRWLRVEIDRVRRERVQKSRKKQGAELSRIRSESSHRSRMTTAEVEAAFRSYEDGVTIAQLAAALWRKHDFSSIERCYASLHQRFASLGLTKAA